MALARKHSQIISQRIFGIFPRSYYGLAAIGRARG
jgi:polyphosphate kinase 2 (PPK2 family)